MKRVKKLQEKGFYILEAKNAANTHFIENEREVDQFLIFANSHFREFVDIYDYCITPTGWHLLIRIKNSSAIISAYETIQYRRNKTARLQNVNLILSNQVRMLRLRMTRWTNKKRGRKGNASMQVFRKYILDTLEEGLEQIQNVRNQGINLEQPLEKYQALADNYEIKDYDHQVKQKMSSKNRVGKRSSFLKCLRLGDYVTTHLEKWIKATLEMHSMGDESAFVMRV